MSQNRDTSSLIGKISSYLQIVSKDPHSTAFVPLAEAFRQIGLLDDALEAARMGTGTLPHFSPGFATLGRILGQMGRIDEAMSAYARALSIDRQSQSALVGLARLHLVRGERDMARKILLQAAEFHPEDDMVANMLVALDLPRPWGEALEPVAAAIPVEEPEPVMRAAAAEVEAGGEPIPTATLAEIYVKQGLPDQAMRVYEEVLRREPGNATALARLAELRGVPAVAAVAPATVSQEASSAPIPPVQGPARTTRSPLEEFESWLQAIQLRRAHVH